MDILESFIANIEKSGLMSPEKAIDVLLAQSRRYTSAEAGTVFLTHGDMDNGEGVITSCAIQNDAVRIEAKNFSLPANLESIVGYVAVTGTPVEIEDLYEIDQSKVPYSFNKKFDEEAGYHSQSMLAIPLKNIQGKIVGVMQLINHIKTIDENDRAVYTPFPEEHFEDMQSISTMLGIMIEYMGLLHQVEDMKLSIPKNVKEEVVNDKN